MGDPRQKRAKAIQAAIRRVLFKYWDPIGTIAPGTPEDEYDAYVGGVYRRLIEGAADAEIIEYLRVVSPGGIAVSNTRLLFVMRKLREIDVHIGFTV